MTAGSVRALRAGVGTAAVFAAGILGAFGAFVPAQAAGALLCAEDEIPSPGNSNPSIADGNIAVYAGEDFVATGSSAESEGLLVVRGDARFERVAGVFNIGTVGVGSGVTPEPGSVMLAVGGDLSLGDGLSRLIVGAPTSGFAGGGAVRVGGEARPDYDSGRYDTDGGSFKAGLGADTTAEYAHFGAVISQTSATYAALASTGTVTKSGAQATFAGTGAGQEIFRIDASALSGASEILFTGIAEGATVVVNVTGGIVNWSPNHFADGSVRVDDPTGGTNGFGKVSSRTLWNFADASDVHIGGSSQVLGSILIPTSGSALSFSASLNGRVYVNGSITMDGEGNEIHNYPFQNELFSCTPKPTTPVEPAHPEQPAGPGTGITPETPAEVPGGTDEPAAPEQPADSERPAAPEQQDQDAAPQAAAQNGELAQTGGVLRPWMIGAGAALLAGGGVLIITAARRRRSSAE
ncbi:choice-of-anchor A family protein [Microbacterium sp. NPDC057650]|uniref:choice-of-anchor A family protein n=1 Tax=unclassified Microbacterium TaxID=2609290 RepID=UPI003670E07C